MHKEFMYTKMQETKHLCFLIQNTVYSTKPIVFTRKILSIQMPLLYKLYMIHINYMYTYHIQNILYILSYTK